MTPKGGHRPAASVLALSNWAALPSPVVPGRGREGRPRGPLNGAGKAVPAGYPEGIGDRPRSARALAAVAVGAAGRGAGNATGVRQRFTL
jgi:hypothetical protein